MEIGTQYEGEARVEFWMRYGAEVEETGLVLHPTFNYLGASPDGYVMENGIAIPIEFKVPLAKTHQLYLGEGVVPEIYVPQLMTEMLCCDRAPYGYFASYCPPDIFPALPDHMRMFRVKLMADEAKFAEIEEAATATMEHVIERVAKLRAMYPEKGAPKSKFVAELETAVLATERSEADEFADTMAVMDRYFGPAAMFRVDIPEIPARQETADRPRWLDGKLCPIGTVVEAAAIPGRSRYIGPSAVYAMNPASEEAVRVAVARMVERDVKIISLPSGAMLTAPDEADYPDDAAMEPEDEEFESF